MYNYIIFIINIKFYVPRETLKKIIPVDRIKQKQNFY